MHATVQTILKTFVILLMMIFFLSIFFFAVTYTQAIGFKSFVNEQINREGGMTSQATANIQTYNEQQYNSRFTVESLSGTDKKPYGESVSYRISGQAGAIGFDFPVTLINIEGTSISKIR